MSSRHNVQDATGVVERLPPVGNIQRVGAGPPSNGSVGDAPGCIYQDYTNGNLYKNAGSNTSATWTLITDAAAGGVLGVGIGYKVARGQATTVAAVDTIITGLATVVAVLATLDSDPGDDPFMVSASIGDQAGTPAAGSFLLKSWKNTGGTDPTPVAATTFGKKVNWVAVGT